MSKYIGTKDGLIGPVPEAGKEYTKGVDFYLHDTTPPHKAVAVPLPAAPQGEIILMGPDKDKSPWPLLGYAPGNYSNRCAECKKGMMGVDKLCFQCLECAARCANEIIAGKPAAPQEGAQDIPEWYTKDRMYDWLIQNNYSKEIAAELSEAWARDCQGAFKKGWEKATNDGKVIDPKDYVYYTQPTTAVNDGGDGWIDISGRSDSGIPELEEILNRFQAKEFNIIGLIDKVWNKAYYTGTAYQSPIYPAEFVEWVGYSYRFYNDGRGRKFWLKYYDDLTPITEMDMTEYTTAELYQEWKRIKEQSK